MDPLRMVLVLRRGAVGTQARACALGGAAAVACLRGVGAEPGHAADVDAWRARPGKVCLRARNRAQWEQVLELPHAVAGDPGGEAALAIPPMRRGERPELLDRLQAMATALEPPPVRAAADDDAEAVTYVLNPAAPMSSGKTVAQVAHAAVAVADTGAAEAWVAAGCPARALAPDRDAFTALCRRDDLAARVVDAGLTEVPPGTVTVVALAPGPASALPAGLRA